MTLGPDRRIIARRGHAATPPLTFAGMFPQVFHESQNSGGGNGEGGEGQNGPPAGGEQKPTKVEFTPEQNEWIGNKIAYELKKAQEKRDADEAEAKKKADAEAERKKAEDAGKFEEVKTSLISERDTALAERKAIEAERDEYRELVTKDVNASWSALPEEIREAYDGADDDVLAKKRHMTRMAKVIERLTGDTTSPAGGNRPNPKPGSAAFNVADEAARARARGGYRI